MTEEELLHSIRNNPAHFSEVFRLYYPPIFGYIFRRLGKFEDAADVTADTFLKAFTHINHFAYRGVSVKVWLYRIATNEVNLYFRTKRKRSSIIKSIDMADKGIFQNYINDDKQQLERELEKHQQFIKVQENLKSLAAKYQNVLSLKYFEGKTNKEIALILQLKGGTIKSLLSRGLEKLREKCNHL